MYNAKLKLYKLDAEHAYSTEYNTRLNTYLSLHTQRVHDTRLASCLHFFACTNYNTEHAYTERTV